MRFIGILINKSWKKLFKKKTVLWICYVLNCRFLSLFVLLKKKQFFL